MRCLGVLSLFSVCLNLERGDPQVHDLFFIYPLIIFVWRKGGDPRVFVAHLLHETA
jgi:hypothetical protein